MGVKGSKKKTWSAAYQHFSQEWNFEAKGKKINSTSQRPYLHLPVSSVYSIESFKDPIQKIPLLWNLFITLSLQCFQKDLKKVAALVRHLPENFPLVIPLLPFGINWLKTEFLVPNFHRWSLNIFVLDNNCLTDCFIPDQNFPFPDRQACSLSFTQKFLWKDIW